MRTTNTRYIALEKGCILTPQGRVEPGTLLIEGARIAAHLAPDEAVPAEAARRDATGLTLVPGFVDAHVHGGNGWQLDTDDAASLLHYARWAPRTGVTSFLPTTLGLPMARLAGIAAAVRAAMEAQRDGTAGAHILGVHAEGPFLNPVRPGALSPDWMQAPSRQAVETIIEGFGGLLRRMTLAPELPGALDLVRVLRHGGVQVSAGHSDASFEQAVTAFENGVTSVTHLFNAMPPLHHRAPGLTGAALLPGVCCEIIPDGIHVHTGALQLVRAAKSPAEVLAVTDAMQAAARPDGEYYLGSQRVTVRDGAARLASGALAGSTLTADRGLRLLVREVGLSLGDAVTMLSTTPARMAGAEATKGRLLPGFDADVVALDADLRVAWTMCRGEISATA